MCMVHLTLNVLYISEKSEKDIMKRSENYFK